MIVPDSKRALVKAAHEKQSEVLEQYHGNYSAHSAAVNAEYEPLLGSFWLLSLYGSLYCLGRFLSEQLSEK